MDSAKHCRVNIRESFAKRKHTVKSRRLRGSERAAPTGSAKERERSRQRKKEHGARRSRRRLNSCFPAGSGRALLRRSGTRGECAARASAKRQRGTTEAYVPVAMSFEVRSASNGRKRTVGRHDFTFSLETFCPLRFCARSQHRHTRARKVCARTHAYACDGRTNERTRKQCATNASDTRYFSAVRSSSTSRRERPSLVMFLRDFSHLPSFLPPNLKCTPF